LTLKIGPVMNLALFADTGQIQSIVNCVVQLVVIGVLTIVLENQPNAENVNAKNGQNLSD